MAQQQQPIDIAQVVANLQAEVAQLQADLASANQQLAAQNAPPVQPVASVLPSSVKPRLPDDFKGQMDGVSVSRFVHQLDTYFDLVGLTDNVKRAQIAITLLKDSAFTWYQTQGVTAAHGWLRLRNAMMRYFKPADYAFKTRLALAKWQQRGSVTDYIVGFSERYTACADVDANEALFRFLDGLQPSVQAWVRTQQPHDLQAAMQAAEQIGQTLATATFATGRNKSHKRHVPVAVPVASDMRSQVVPMELGSARFSGACYNCGKVGHRAAECRLPRRQAASQPVTNRPNKNKGKFQAGKGKFNNAQLAVSYLQSLVSQQVAGLSSDTGQASTSAGAGRVGVAGNASQQEN